MAGGLAVDVADPFEARLGGPVAVAAARNPLDAVDQTAGDDQILYTRRGEIGRDPAERPIEDRHELPIVDGRMGELAQRTASPDRCPDRAGGRGGRVHESESDPLAVPGSDRVAVVEPLAQTESG